MSESSDVPDPAEEVGPFGLDCVAQDQLLDLDRRLSRRLAAGRSIQVSGTDLDLFVAVGAYAKFNESVAIVTAFRSAARLQEVARSRAKPPPNDLAGQREHALRQLERAQHIVGLSDPATWRTR